MKGDGIYDRECRKVFRELEAEVAVLLIMGGNRGNGCAVGVTDPRNLAPLPALLRALADGIEEDLAALAQGRMDDLS